MGMGFAPTWLCQVSPLLHTTTLATGSRLGRVTLYKSTKNLSGLLHGASPF